MAYPELAEGYALTLLNGLFLGLDNNFGKIWAGAVV